jgi:alpha-tubulin suppressor-like RCC1 family protein
MWCRLGRIARGRSIGAFVVAATGFALCALPASADDGSIVAWGQDAYGQCDVPAPNLDFVAIEGGSWHTIALKVDGSIRAWGRNDYGQTDLPSPNSGFIAVAAGERHNLALKSDGSIVAWGLNNYGQCTVPLPNAGFVAIAAGGEQSLGLKSDGSIVAWGRNDYGQCSVPAPNSNFIAVAAGGLHSLGLKGAGSIVVWGYNTSGQCNVPSPNANFIAVAGGGEHSLGLKSDGSIVAWGLNGDGQCNVPSPNTDFVGLAGGYYHSLGLKSDGSVRAWGRNDYGQCNLPSPNAGFTAVAAGWWHSLGLMGLQPEMIYSWSMDTSPGWTVTGAWAFGQPTGGGSHNGDPQGGHTGTNVYGYNLNGDYTNNMPARYLTTTAINCGNATGIELRFWRWLGVEATDHAGIEMSTDGTTWTAVWSNSGVVSDSAWSQQTYALGAAADYQSTLYLRWVMGPTDQSVTYPGWNIDDVEIWGSLVSSTGACCFPDGHCEVLAPADCNTGGGTYQGDPSCAPDTCPQPGACCFADGHCEMSTVTAPGDCAPGGTYLGDDTVCESNVCPQPGACCFADGHCEMSTVTAPGDCAPGGTYLGDNTDCDPNPCPEFGACCLSGGTCEYLSQPDCTAVNGQWVGAWVPCDPSPCPEGPIGWVQFPGGGFDDRSEAAMAYDTARGVTVLFGGAGSEGVKGDTWEFDGTTWVDRTPADPNDSPPPRCFHAMAYDMNRQVTVLFGGHDPNDLYLKADTWEWDGTTWLDKTPADPNDSPHRRCWHAMAYDSARHVTVLSGGFGAKGGTNDTWEWDGSTWTLRTPTHAPPARCMHAMAYDSYRGVTVLFGGVCYEGEEYSNETWTWDGTDWTVAATARDNPPGRAALAMCFDSADGATHLFGGRRDEGLILECLAMLTGDPELRRAAQAARRDSIIYGDTWSWDGTTWGPWDWQPHPSARYWHAMAYDAAHDVNVLSAGASSARDYSDTWGYYPGGACCFVDGGCQVLSMSGCTEAGGLWHVVWGACEPNRCPQPGACCFSGGHCDMSTIISPGDCAPGGTYQGDNTVCTRSPCVCPGDLNCDGVVNFADINPFVLILSNPTAWEQTYPGCPPLNGDIDGNLSVGFEDINPFVALIVQSPIECQ